jgi:hypothetical protein
MTSTKAGSLLAERAASPSSAATSGPNLSRPICQICTAREQLPPSPGIRRIEVCLCGPHVTALSLTGKTARETARLQAQQQRDRESSGLTGSPDSWISLRQPHPLYWVTTDVETYVQLRESAIAG